MNEPLNPEVAILNAALELPVEQRSAYLNEACAGDVALYQQVRALLESHERAESFLETPLTVLNLRGTDDTPLIEKPGGLIGRYKLFQQIGEGGCGVVYAAEQEEPVRRRVALKILKPGMDTKSVIARFEAERHALALMDHPHIAKVLDAGVTDTGRPFFVMELVLGTKITEFCDERRLSTEERLRLFIQVCQAIQHAHQKGIIHRDIKPSNILVTVNDGVPVPKVIDFGIAKATQGRLTDQTLFTAFDQFIGTPAYMSPEQAVMTSLDVDTRSDIYSLGVLLYELLTGETPFDQKELLAAGLDEMRRTIREVDPLRPSARLLHSAASAKAEIQNPKPKIDRDLDWIVIKCLEKDRTRRYETANGLTRDIERHLSSEPITARPPTQLYRFRKLVRRNKLTVAAVGVLFIALIVVAVSSTLSAWHVAGARRAEQGERHKAETANRQLRQTVSLLELERAEDLFRANDSAGGAAHLAAILRRDPSNHIAANRLVSALSHRNWALPAAPPMRHSGPVESARFSPDGRYVLSASRDNTAKVWDAVTGSLVATLQHSGQVFSAHYSAKGDRAITVSESGGAQIWSPANGAILTPPLQHTAKIHSASFSRDGLRAVTASADKTARIWDVVSGELQRELRGHSGQVVFARFHPNGKRVMTANAFGSIRMWDADSGELLFRCATPVTNLVALDFSPDGRWLLSASGDGVARLWNADDGRAVGRPLVHKKAIDHAGFSPDSRSVLTCARDDTAQLWETESGYPIGRPLPHEGRVLFGAFSPDSRLVVTTSLDNSARVWDVATGLLLCQPLRESERILHAEFSSDGGRLVTSSYDSIVQIWDIRPRRFTGIKIYSEGIVTSAAFSPDGKSVLTASRDKTARLWDARSGKALREPMRHDFPVFHAEFSADGGRAVTACAEGIARVWNLATGAVVAGPFGHAKRIGSAHFSSDGERIVIASDTTARVWNARTGAPLTPPLTHQGEVNMAQFHSDGRLVVTASKDRSARVWDAQTGQPVTEPLWHLDHVQWAEFNRGGERIVTASTDNTACIWDARTGQRVAPPLQHARIVEHAAFSPDGQRIATASFDRTARIWDSTTGQAMTPPLQHDSPLTRVVFSPDGRRILTGCQDGSIRIWDPETARPLTEWLDAGDHVSSICFDAAGECVATAANQARIWSLPEAPAPVPAWFPAFAEAIAGIRLSERGNVEIVPRSELVNFAQQFTRQNARAYYEKLAQWFLTDPAGRSPAPF